MLSVGYGHPENHSVRKWLHNPSVHCIIEVDSSVSEMYLKRYTFNGMFLSGKKSTGQGGSDARASRLRMVGKY